MSSSDSDQQREVRTRLLSASPAAVEEAAQVIRRGGLVAFPTDTVYGLGAHTFQPASVERLYWAKGRPEEKAIPLLLAHAEDLAMVAQPVPPDAWALTERFWPGGLTLVLPARPEVPTVVTAGTGAVAVRLPNHPVAVALIAAVGVPLATTSANRSGQASLTTAQEVLRDLEGRIDLILDGGRCPGGVPSSILDLTGPAPRLLRKGAVAVEELQKTLGRLVEITSAG